MLILGVAGPTGAPSGTLTAPVASTNYPGLTITSIVPVPAAIGAPVPQTDCKVSPWSDWTKCSQTCGVGYQERARTVLTLPGPGGVPCPKLLSRRRRCFRRC